VQLLGELLFGSDGWDCDRRYSGKIQQVPKCDSLYRGNQSRALLICGALVLASGL
jgi:hypothetical protein